MSYLAHQKDFGPHVCSTRAAPAVPVIIRAATGWRHAVRRLLGRIFEPRHEQFDREIGEFIARSGGSLTDNLERELMQHVIRSGVGTWR